MRLFVVFGVITGEPQRLALVPQNYSAPTAWTRIVQARAVGVYGYGVNNSQVPL